MRALLLAGILTLTAHAQTSGASVQGRIVDAVTNAPVRKAVVTLIRKTEKPEFLSVRSDSAGKFAFEDLQPGDYSLSGGARGYVSVTEYTSLQPHTAGTLFSMAPGQKRTDLVLRLTPQAAISGRVVDVDGDPLQGVQVQLWQLTYRSGRKELAADFEHKTATDDRGVYRIAEVPAGNYYLSAFDPETYSPKDEMRYVRTFYPGVLDDAAAAPLLLTAGAELENINFKLTPVHTVHIHGKILEDAFAGVSLIPDNTLVEYSDRIIQRLRAATDGRFEFHGVLAGSYNLVVRAGEDHTWIRRSIAVGAADVDGVAIQIAPPAWIDGRLKIEGEADADPSRYWVSVTPAYPNTVVYGSPSGKPDKTGVFRVANLAPDRYRITAGGAGGNLYLKSVRLGGQELPGGILDLGASAQIEVVLSRKTASVRGAVSPAGEATIVLIPEERDRRELPAAYPRITTDAAGRFTIDDIAPGLYRAYAWTNLDHNDYRYMDPDFVKSVEGKGVPVTLAESAHSALELVAAAVR